MFNMNNPILQQILNSKLSDIQKTPQYQEVLKMTYGKTPQEISNMAEQMARKNGLDINQLRQMFG